jgi:hypothetical protein
MYRYVQNLLSRPVLPDLTDEVIAGSLVTMDRRIHFKPALDAIGEA